MQLEFILSRVNIVKLKADVLVIGIFKGQRYSGAVKSINDSLGNALKNISEEERFEGDLGKSLMLSRTLGKIGSKRVLMVGLGEKTEFSTNTLRKIGTLVTNKVKGLSSIIAFSSELFRGPGHISALTEGLLLGSYEFNKYKTNNSEGNEIEKVIFASKQVKAFTLKEETDFARLISESTNLARDLVNEPPVYLTPRKLAEVASQIAKDGGLNCEIFDYAEIERRGMNGLMAVSSGSEEPPRFIHLTYEPPRKSRRSIAIVGKGITFDSGGLCLKPPDSMRTMKMDMGGSAVVLGVMKAIAVLQPSVRVHGLIAASENMTGAKAYKPDDVIRAYNGKTIEVINTDAEGRIVLSDALCYAVELKVDEIVDLATLTGACMVGLGSYTAGVMGNNQTLIDKIRKASDSVGEKTWQLPMDDELRVEIKSNVADIKNAGSRMGGAITAAMFLENFVGDVPWAHIDIAGPAFLEKGSDWSPKGATGFGVRTIIQYITGK
ncbi:MAG: leucyl aminopeptidase [Candidatus Dadabacteria bacterium]|nr:MAG: leucyl aminopeptidase [Candidatus Dadabacteria bacterium]TDI99779.1 MAG: leucyl aminopeptidase [Candidatus Dadabacteria bacterium]